jgi:N-acyl-D-glutamate deacylase
MGVTCGQKSRVGAKASVAGDPAFSALSGRTTLFVSQTRDAVEDQGHLSKLSFMRAISTLLLGGILATQVYTAQTVQYDVVIRNGRVMDPETGLDAVRNVGIRGDTVARITTEPLQGARTIDARGLVVAPGFIELFQHAHDPESYRLNALDGVTSSLDLEVVNGGILDTKAFTGHALLHYGTNAGHGAARQAVFDASVAAAVPPVARPSRTEPGTPEQLTRVRELVRKELDGGGLGVSVVTWPGITRFEVIEMFRLAAERQSLVVVRPRSRGKIEPGSSVEAIEEIIGAAAITGASTHIIQCVYVRAEPHPGGARHD